MEANISRKGLVNWLLLLVVAIAALVSARYANSMTGIVTAAFMGVGFLVAAVSYFQMRLEQRELLERMEFDELRRTASRATLFAEQAVDSFPARRAREQFEQFLAPAFAILLMILQVVGAYLMWQYLRDEKPATLQQSTVAMALFGLFALVLFQFGKYSAVLAQLEKSALLRPQASYLLLASLLALVTALVEVAGWAGYPKVDLITARVLIVLFGLVGVESLLTLILERFRPRLRGQVAHVLYGSRVISLLSQPGGLVTTAAQALDYQFGFKVSETWFYRFFERAIAWLVLLQLGALLASTMFVVIEPGEEAVLERAGRPVPGREVLGPGLHVKLPWPIDKIYRYHTDRIQSFVIGIEHDKENEHERTILWSKPHGTEYNMLVASRSQVLSDAPSGEQAVPVNLLTVNIPVQYQIRDIRAFAYNHANADELLQQLANAEVTRYLVSVDLDDIMGAGRTKAADELRARIQARADSLKLGVRILFVGLFGIHPPVKIAPEFERVVGAIQEKEATNLYARAYLAERVPLARAEGAKRVNEAEAYRARVIAAAEASASRFTNQAMAYQAAPAVYKVRSYLDSVAQSVAGARTYIITPTNAHGVIMLDLEDKIRRDLLETPLPPASRK